MRSVGAEVMAWEVVGALRLCVFFFSSRRRHTRLQGDWSSDVCSSDLGASPNVFAPAQLYQLNSAIETHLSANERPVVYADDLAMIEAVHGREDLRAWIDRKSVV